MSQEDIFNNLCDSVDTDEEFLETLLPYLESLLAIGINLNDLALQQAIEGNFQQLETACRAMIGYAGSLAHSGKSFDSATHATRCFTKALAERWEPNSSWKEHAELLPQAKYVSPYEKARQLIHELQARDTARGWNPQALDPLSDEEIKAFIPKLEAYLNTLL
jgi:hypothetical protein